MTYEQLRQAIYGYFGNAGDPDPNFEAYVPTIIEVAEGNIYSQLRHPQMVVRPYLTELSADGSGSAPYELPADCLEPHGIVDTRKWVFESPEQFFNRYNHGCPAYAGMPYYWTVHGKEVVVNPEATATAVFSYYKKPPALASDDTAPLFVLYPDLFVKAALPEAARWLREDDSIIMHHQQEFARRLQEVRLDAWGASIPKAQPLKVRNI
jgi:hypothetical protein